MKPVKNTVTGTRQTKVPREQYHAWLPNAHPAYITEERHDEILKQIIANRVSGGEQGGAVREGSSLLQGIAICGIYGRKMAVNYHHAKYGTQPVYKCDKLRTNHGQDACQWVVGGNIDLTIERLLLETINPMTTQAAISIQQEMTARKEEIVRAYSRQMERARYEMDLAKRRYLRVDPDNRLVAAELERDWEQKVSEHESAKMAYEQKCETEISAIDDKLRFALEQLVSDFPKIWNDPQTSNKEKKRIARLILEDVTITTEPKRTILGVRFKGGGTRVLEVPKVPKSLDVYDMEQLVVEDIRKMLPSSLTYQEMAEILNEKGYKFGNRRGLFDQKRVRQLVVSYGLPRRKEIACEEGWLTFPEKMAELGVGKSQLYRLKKADMVVYKKSHLPGRPCLFAPEDAKV